jgi:predicted LPLAT superfamily acyltransferase
MMFRPCCVIPSRNHHLVIGEVVRQLRAAGLPVLVVDDASDEPARSVLARLHAPDAGITVVRLTERAGKGGAVIAGMERALAAGFSHVLQVDADGQHDLSRLTDMLRLAAEQPDSVISGTAIYDRSVPRARRYGRYATHVWVWIETLSFQLTDTMCGFRVYPLAPVMALLRSEAVGRFMDFDTEILVRLFWRNVAVRMVPVRVIYPSDNSSNFELWRDNWRITRMHTRLFFTMLARLPSILANRRRQAAAGHRVPSHLATGHWATLGERGQAWGIHFLAQCYLVLGGTACRAVMLPVVLYFYLTDAPRRRASRQFLARAFAAGGWARAPGEIEILWHFLDFAEKTLESFAAWTGRIAASRVRTDDATPLAEAQASARGALLIVSHLGNIDLSRALLDGKRRARLTVLVHTTDAEHYNGVLRRFQPDSATNLLQVTEIGPETGILLQELVARGEWIAIAGDRTPVGGAGRVSQVPFLGMPAPFSSGPYILAHLLGCPVYLMFCLREKGGYRLHFERFAERIELPRGAARDEALAAHAGRYARRLADLAQRAPFQWYNFFDFWAQ